MATFDIRSPKVFNASFGKGKQSMKPIATNEMRDVIMRNYGLNG